MVCAGALRTVTVEDQRLYIKIETLRGKNPTEIHSALLEVRGEQTVDRSTVSPWATCFREGRVTMIMVAMTKCQEGRKHQQMNEV